MCHYDGLMNKQATEKEPQWQWMADLNLLMVAVIWGVNMPIMKFALGQMDEYLFNAIRLSFSALVLGLFYYSTTREVLL